MNAPSIHLARSSLLALVLVAGGLVARADDPPAVPEGLVQMWVEKADYSASRKSLELYLRIEIAEGWHIQAHQPSLETLIPTTLSVDPGQGFRVGEIDYPEPSELPFTFAGGKRLKVYHDAIQLRIPLTVEEGFSEKGVSFEAELRYQACDATRCLRPAMVERTFVVKSPPTSGKASTDDVAPVDRWLARQGLGPTLLLVAAMGLGLNLTPCVYPLISVTLAYFGSQSRERRGRVFLLSLVYALGIAITFSVLGVSAALSGSLFGAAMQKPWTLVAVAALMVALALASFGLYTLQPPAWILQRLGGASVGFAGALLMGLTMGLVAAPCVGPIIVGLLVTVGTRGDPFLGFLLFFTLSLGLGLPYVILASAAGALVKLPRSGEWLVWVEHLFGFLLLGMALYFLSPLLSRSALPWIVVVFLTVMGLYLGFIDGNGRALPYFPFAKRAFGVVVIVAGLWSGLPSAAGNSIPWQPFSDQLFGRAKEEGKPVVLDFRADWCLPCLEMERTTFLDPGVTSRTGRFTMLRADVTEDSPGNDRMLSRFEVLGVPTTIFYDRTGQEYRRRIGYINAADFRRLLDETANQAGSPTQARNG